MLVDVACVVLFIFGSTPTKIFRLSLTTCIHTIFHLNVFERVPFIVMKRVEILLLRMASLEKI